MKRTENKFEHNDQIKLDTNLANAINKVTKEEPRRANDELLPNRPIRE